MLRMGCTVMPGLFMSASRKLMPRCLGASGLVRARKKIQSDRCAPDVQIFAPLTR